MPVDKKVICPASSSQQKARQHSADKACIINNRRRDMYKQLSSDKKEALLLQRRTRYGELSNQNFLCASLNTLPNSQLRLTGQRGSTFHIDSSTVVPGKGKSIIGCLSIFEVGSTSAAPIEQDNPNTITIAAKGSTSLAYQSYDSNTMTEENRDSSHCKLIVVVIGGSGKTFLYRALLATIRSKGFIALATTASDVAALILPGGRTTHSRFKIPINIDKQFSCNISTAAHVQND